MEAMKADVMVPHASSDEGHIGRFCFRVLCLSVWVLSSPLSSLSSTHIPNSCAPFLGAFSPFLSFPLVVYRFTTPYFFAFAFLCTSKNSRIALPCGAILDPCS